MDVARRSKDLGKHGNSQGHGKLCSVALNSMLFDQKVSCFGCKIKCGVHGGSITHTKKSKSPQRSAWFGLAPSELSSKHRVTPHKKRNVSKRSRRHLVSFTLNVVLDLANVQHEFCQVGNSVSSEVNDESQTEGESTEKCFWLEHHFTGLCCHGLHQTTLSSLDNRFVDDTDQGTDEERSSKRTSKFFWCSLSSSLDKLVGVEMRVTKFPITGPEVRLFYLLVVGLLLGSHS
mmetsp:Transcript_21415/g.27693  ORF Transcript_21415/g.27693 Transcript_21415/m.27693 type:complete len:232 (+) Transcript_21415:504-1199(+)